MIKMYCENGEMGKFFKVQKWDKYIECKKFTVKMEKTF
jgi:hypothetical protein